MKKVLSKTDIKQFVMFEKQYPGWKIHRMEDNSMVFHPPIRKSLEKKVRWWEKLND